MYLENLKNNLSKVLIPCKKCGIIPEERGWDFVCPSCGEKFGSYGGLINRIVWWNINQDLSGNHQFNINGYNYYGADLHIDMSYLGGRQEYHNEYVLFKTSDNIDKHIINQDKLSDLSIIFLEQFDKVYNIDWLNKPKRYLNIARLSCITGNMFLEKSSILSLRIASWSDKYNYFYRKMLTEVDPDYKY